MRNQTVELLVKALDSKRAREIQVLDLSDISDVGDYFILATGTSSVAVKALADVAEEKAREAGISPHHIEGYQSAAWILQDYGDVLLHIFNVESRAFYSLEHLWADAKQVDITDLLTRD